MTGTTHDQLIRDQFTRQARAFNSAWLWRRTRRPLSISWQSSSINRSLQECFPLS